MGSPTKFAPVLPNRKSALQTASSFRVDLHYARLGVIARWDWDRFLRLCQFLNLTTGEMASLIALPHARLANAERRNRFSGPAALLLTLFEAQALKDFSTDIIANPFPNDPPQSPSA